MLSKCPIGHVDGHDSHVTDTVHDHDSDCTTVVGACDD